MSSLRESDHPYYCTEGNYYFSPARSTGEVHTTYNSWADFIDDWGNTDPDMNLVFRWDWQKPDPSDYEPYDIGIPPETLQVFWVLQRKAILRSTECVVTPEDEPAVRAWLEDRARTVAAIWAPISLGEGEARDDRA